MWRDPIVRQLAKIPGRKRKWEWLCQYCSAKRKASSQLKAVMDAGWHMRTSHYAPKGNDGN